MPADLSGPPRALLPPMTTRSLLLISIPVIAACGPPAPVVISGEISAEGRCSATIGDHRLVGPEEGVRVVSRTRRVAGQESQQVIIVYCLLSSPEDEDPVRLDFVKLDAPETRVLEEGRYAIDPEGDQPRSIGVVVTAPGYLDVTREWQPVSGTLEVTSATGAVVEAVFEMELVPGGARTY
jgi:hypothetical protein